MADIRKRTGSKGTTYQVRYPSKSTKSGFAYKSFDTLKEARYWHKYELPKLKEPIHKSLRNVDQAIGKWLDVCRYEGRHGKDPVSPATMEVYEYRADIMREYDWNKELHELEPPDIVQFRSWLLKNYTRDQARKVLSSFHSAMLEMITQGALIADPATGVSIQESRYKEPVKIPSIKDVKNILVTCDKLANSKNADIARAWERYRPMIYMAADSGMRPQEYLVVPYGAITAKGVNIVQALDRSNVIGVPKSRAGRRFIPVGKNTLRMAKHCYESYQGINSDNFVFPAKEGGYQSYNNYLRRGWHKLMDHADMMEEVEEDGRSKVVAKYTPYSLRHFYASKLIADKKNLKHIQTVMGHADIKMTLDVYGHLIHENETAELEGARGILGDILGS